MIRQLKAVELSIDKLDIIEKYPQCRNLLEITYNPFKHFAVGTKQIDKELESTLVDIPKIDKPYIMIHHFYNFLNDSLLNKRYSRSVGIKAIKRWCTIFPEYETLIINIFNKNLKCGIDAQLINCIYPKLIPMFNPTRPKIWDTMCPKRVFSEYVTMEKVEGELVYMSIRNRKVNIYSKHTIPIVTLNYLKDEVQSFIDITDIDNIMIEGHVFIGNQSFDESHQGIVRGSKKLTNIIFKVYDILTLDEFEVYYDESKKYTDRHKRFAEMGFSNLSMIQVVPYQQYDPNGEHILSHMKTTISDNNWKGAILRKNIPYDIKISYNIIKVYPNS
jgi:hypothetical protein